LLVVLFLGCIIPGVSKINPMDHAINDYNNSLSEAHRFPEGYYDKSFAGEPYKTPDTQSSIKEEPTNPAPLNRGPRDSPWPMYSHDVHHTGLSPYSTANNPLIEKWRFPLSWSSFYTGFILDANGIIYGGPDYVFAIFQNGTEKWRFNTYNPIESTPAIDENGVLYVGTIWGMPNYLYAIYSNNGTLK
jgi:PQQ-like domain